MIREGDVAPDFTLTGLDGLRYSLHEAAGKGPVLLAFWKADCGTCELAAPYLSRLYDAYENLEWSFWAIGQNEAAEARQFVEEFGFRPTMLIDGPAWVASKAYDPDATPTLYLVEPPSRRVTLISIGFDKADLNEISRRVAAYAGAACVEVAPAGDGAPAFQPG
jgi:peroxiredoxin